MRARVRAFDWGTTYLGPMPDWPASRASIVETVLSHGFPMIVLLGPQLIQIYNDAYAVVLGGKHPGGLGQPTRVCWPEVWHINGPIYDSVMQGQVITREDGLYPLARSGVLKDAWFTLTYSPVREPGGAISGVLVTMIETTARILAERQRDEIMARLRMAERRQRFLLELGDRLRSLSDPDEVRRTALAMIAVQVDADRVELRDAPADGIGPCGGDVAGVVTVRLCREGALHRVFVAERARPWDGPEVLLIRQAAERSWAAMEKAEAEAALRASLEYQKLLLSELQHRVRNSLGVIGLIAERSGDGATQVGPYRQAFLGRLAAFARVQAAVTRDPDAGLDLRRILTDELEAFGRRQLHLEGPQVLLRPRAAERIALALHELATNAAKYGGLGVPGGGLHVNWHLEGGGMTLIWSETGLQGLTPPAHQGFGTEIIQQALAYDLGARTVMDYRDTGLWCRIHLPSRNLA